MMWLATIVDAAVPLVAEQSRACHKKQEGGKSTQFPHGFHRNLSKRQSYTLATFSLDWNPKLFCCGVHATDWIRCSDLDKMEPFITRPMQGNGIRGCLWIYEEFCGNWSQVHLEPGLLLLGTVWGLYGSLKKHAESYKIASSGV